MLTKQGDFGIIPKLAVLKTKELLMASKKTTAQALTNSENEKYLTTIFSILKRVDNVVAAHRKSHFNNTELRLIREVLCAKKEGGRLISTQLATRLGVTRSAVSQIVNRLEEKGIVKRVPDAVDRKIAYVEISEDALEAYREDIEVAGSFLGQVVGCFGKEKFKQMCSLLDGFFDCMKGKNPYSSFATIQDEN